MMSTDTIPPAFDESASEDPVHEGPAAHEDAAARSERFERDALPFLDQLYRILNNTFISNYRKAQRQPKQADVAEVEDWQEYEASTHSSQGLVSAEAEAIERLPDSEIRDALTKLPEDRRLAVYLADVEGFSYQEIAEIMDTPIGTVMSRLYRGRRQLRELLADYAKELGYGTKEKK